ncbi:hypothetical protein SNE40_020399 [Patella caerulea]|uniref:Zinc finger protein 862-like n=1 Tax=Patella caerulea TaxID=87958 RepID=A0AAN8J186_PATCE
MGSDEAAVMLGKRGGEAALLKSHCPHLVEVHCVAHRLALAIVDVAKKSPDVSSYESMLNILTTYFRRSPKQLSQLRQDILDQPKVKPPEVHRVRWLSMTQAIDNIIKTLPALLKMLEDQAENDITASPLYEYLKTYRFMFMTAFLQDLFTGIGILSRGLQSRDLNYEKMTMLVHSFILSLKSTYLVDSPEYGPKLGLFYVKLETHTCRTWDKY